ncbi:MAG: PDGLE domain-containing protein [Methanopyri archaeon]|nr:PDGLE domain-containing protein [Methanopyri archaeon]
MEWKYSALIIALSMAALLSPYASPDPDGLERVAEDKGFIEKGEGHDVFTAPMPDYEVPNLGGALKGPVAGIIGTLVMFGLGILLGGRLKEPEGERAEEKDQGTEEDVGSTGPAR